MSKYKVIVHQHLTNNDFRCYHVRNEIFDDSAVVDEIEKIEGIIPRVKDEDQGFASFFMRSSDAKRYHFGIKKATAFDWDELDASIFRAIALILYGCVDSDLEIKYKYIDSEGNEVKNHIPDEVATK